MTRSQWPVGDDEMARRFREHDWASTPLGPIDSWPQTLRVLVDLIVASSSVMAIAWGREAIALYNEGYARLIGARHPEAFARSMFATFAAVRHAYELPFEKVWRGATVQLAGQRYQVTRNDAAEDAWFDITYSPIREQGAVVGVFSTMVETTVRVHAERKLREREADLARMQRIGEVGGLDIDVANDLTSWRSPEYLRLHGLPPDARKETHAEWLARVHPEDRERAQRILHAALHDPNSNYDNEYRIIRRSDGAVRWIHARADIERDANGKPLRLVGVHVDITNQKRMQESLRESEERQAFLLRLNDALRPLPNAAEIQDTAMHLLGNALGAAWTCYGEYDEQSQRMTIRADYRRSDLPSLIGTHSIASFDLLDELIAGRTVTIDDISTSAFISEASRQQCLSSGMRSMIAVPMKKQASLIAVLIVAESTPCDWSVHVRMIEATARRTWVEVERARAETALRDNEERLSHLFEALPVGVAMADRDGVITRLNPRMRRYLPTGLLPSHDPERIARWRAWTPDGTPIEPDDFPGARALRGESVLPGLEILFRTDEGQEVWTQISAIPVRNRDGDITGTICVIADIDALKRSETALRENEERLSLAIDVGELASWDWDLRTGEIAWNDRHFLIQGYAVDEVMPSYAAWIARVHPEDREQTTALIEEARRTRCTYMHDFRTLHPDDSIRWCSARGHFFYDEEGKPYRMIGVMEDVTERKLAEAALRESETRYRTLFDSIDEGFCVIEMLFDAQGNPCDYRFLQVNPAFERLTGLTDAVGKTMRTFAPEHEAHWFEIYGRIARTGTPERFENRADALGRWYDVYAFRIDEPTQSRVGILFNDIMDRKRREWNNDLLDRIGKDLASLQTPDALMEAVGARVGEFLKLSACLFADVSDAEDEVTVHNAWHAADALNLKQTFRLADYLSEEFGRAARAGEMFVVDDTRSDPRVNAENYARLQIGSFVTVPYNTHGHWVGFTAVISPQARHWHKDELELLHEISNRLFSRIERARSEIALRESEERFRQFGIASSDGLWIRDAQTLALEYASPAMETIYGLPLEELRRDLKVWASLIVPDDRDDALSKLARVQKGESIVHDFRIMRPSDGAFRWITSAGFPLLNAAGAVQRVAGISSDTTDAKQLTEHQGVLLAELQHRVRNIMAMIRAVTTRTATTAESVDAYAALMTGRLTALARTQTLLTSAANVGVDINQIVRGELQAQGHAEQFAISGPDVVVSPKAAEILTLAIHELATNALKYGALASTQGRVTVSWRVESRGASSWATLTWQETRPATANWTPPTRRGFGSELIEQRVPYELGGRGKLVVGPTGVQATITFPLQTGASILETDAPVRSKVFGGSMDMSEEPSLAGRRVLVLEDDYYLASDTAGALRAAGAEVAGPFAQQAPALEAIRGGGLSSAIVDINLGSGPSFETAQALRQAGVPFVFLTGYDRNTILEGFRDVPRLEKPTELRQIVRTLDVLIEAAEKA